MAADFDDIIIHDASEDCVACRAQDLVSFMLVPAVAAWEHANQMPQHALPLHGAAALIAFMIQQGARREDIERAVSKLVDNLELEMAEDQAFGGPTQGNA